MKKHYITFLIVCSMLVVAVSQVFGEERIEGSLVLDATRTLEDRNTALLNDLRHLREEREKAIKDKEAAKKKYIQAQEGSLEQKEALDAYSSALVLVMKSLFDELQLARQSAVDLFKTMTSLSEAMQKVKMDKNEKAVQRCIKETRVFLDDGDKILTAIAKYKDLISDPLIKSTLSSVQSTLVKVKQVREVVGRKEIPVKDIAFLINLADKMEGRELRYPLESGQEELF